MVICRKNEADIIIFKMTEFGNLLKLTKVRIKKMTVHNKCINRMLNALVGHLLKMVIFI